MSKKLTPQQEERLRIIENFILWYANDTKHQHQMNEAALLYMEEDHEEDEPVAQKLHPELPMGRTRALKYYMLKVFVEQATDDPIQKDWLIDCALHHAEHSEDEIRLLMEEVMRNVNTEFKTLF